MSKYFKTSDGEEFYTENHAYNHARSLEDKKITPPTVIVEESEDEPEETPVVKLSDLTKAELIAFAADKGIEIIKPKATNAEIIAVIEDALATIAAKELDVDVDTDADADADADADTDGAGTEEELTEKTQE